MLDSNYQHNSKCFSKSRHIWMERGIHWPQAAGCDFAMNFHMREHFHVPHLHAIWQKILFHLKKSFCQIWNQRGGAGWLFFRCVQTIPFSKAKLLIIKSGATNHPNTFEIGLKLDAIEFQFSSLLFMHPRIFFKDFWYFRNKIVSSELMQCKCRL